MFLNHVYCTYWYSCISILPSINSTLPCLTPRGSDDGKVDDTIDIQHTCMRILDKNLSKLFQKGHNFSRNVFQNHIYYTYQFSSISILPSTDSTLPCIKPRGSDDGKVDNTIDMQHSLGFYVKNFLIVTKKT